MSKPARRFALLGVVTAAVVGGGLAVLRWQAPAREQFDPTGMFVVAKAAPLQRALSVAARLSGTRLGEAAATALPIVEKCSLVGGEAADGKLESALAALACITPGTPASDARRRLETELTAGADIAVGAASGGPWTILAARVDDAGGLEGELRFPHRPRDLGMLLAPDENPPGPAVFTASGSVLRGRVRVRDGFDFEALTPRTETTEKLKLPDFTGVFSGALLNGVWEVAVYPAAEGRTVPRIAFALGVHSTTLAGKAMNNLLTEIESSWQLHRSPFSTGTFTGSCLPGLTVLPDLAPCFVLAGDHIAIGWNRDSLTYSLSAPATTTMAPADGDVISAFTIDFAAMTAADAGLTRAAYGEKAAPLPRYPWQELRLKASAPGVMHVGLALRGAP
jgi:hypothetical protein